MRRLCFLLLIHISVGAAELRVDHATVAGRDLKTMMSNLANVGIHCEYGGPHSNHATEMALTSFPDGSYLELIAPQAHADPKALATQVWAKQMRNDAGPCAWAIQSSDLAGELKRLQLSGVKVSQPERGGRERPDDKRLEWETAQIGEEPRGTFFPFAIQDLTPRHDRAFLNGKPTTKDFSGVARIVIVVRDLRDSVQRYRKAFALPPPIDQVDASFGASLALFTGSPVVLAAPLNSNSWLATRLEQFGEGPCAFILGGRKTRHYEPVLKSHWAMEDISWFDTAKLGWHLGFE
ncbi:MAG: VOC family protein [Bryobacteraceae bacterium]